MAETPIPFPARPSQTEPLWRDLVGARLRELRHERDQTLAEVARRAGMSVQYLSELERGVKDPSSEMVAAVAGALETSLLELTSDVADALRSGASRGTVALAA